MLRPDRDVTDLRLFYHTRLGRWVTRRLNRFLRSVWSETQGLLIVGVGYAVPYLAAWPQAKQIAMMPASQGVVRWPTQGPCQTVLSEDHIMPFDDETIDRLVIAHELENTDHLGPLLQECWRVLKPEGRLLVIVPNRLGLWVRSDATPFGYGRAFSSRQLRQVLQNHRFVWEQRHYTLYIPPSGKTMFLSLGGVLEWIGQRLFPQLGGLIVTEASKQVYNLIPPTPRPNAPVTDRKPVLSGVVPSPAG